VRLAEELPEKLPRIFNGTTLHTFWGYKYNNGHEDTVHLRTGIGLHADDALVNVNFWITEDEANEDGTSGGMVVYKAAPPVSMGVRMGVAWE
jgi:hypothetical protein